MSGLSGDMKQAIPDTGWSSATGSDYHIVLLESAARQAQRRRRRNDSRPVSYQIVCPDSSYKLLRFPERSALLQQMLGNYRKASRSGLLPELIWHDNQSLLFEYIDGELPRLDTPGFASEFGQKLAILHREPVRFRNRAVFQIKLHRYALSLTALQVLKPRIAAGMLAFCNGHMPKTLPVTLDVGDIKPENFVLDNSGQLRLVDIGCLRTHWPKGQEVMGDPHFSKLDHAAFREGYLSKQGNDFMFLNENFLRLSHLTFKILQLHRMLRLTRNAAENKRLRIDMESRISQLELSLEQT